MRTQEVIEFFGGKTQAAAALDITAEAIRQWGDYPPMDRQKYLQLLTKGKLKAEPKVIPEHKPIAKAKH